MSTSLLRSVSLFDSLDHEELVKLSALLKRKTYSKNETVFWMHEKGDHLYIIESGLVSISFTDGEGQETELALLKPGSFFGELSLIDGGPHSASARAKTDAVLLALDRASFYHFLTNHPKLAYEMLQVLSQRLRSNTSKVGGMLNANEQLDAERTAFQRSIDRLAKFLTSSLSLSFYIAFVVGWICIQTILYKRSNGERVSFLDAPPTFFILTFFISLCSFFLTVLILNSQRRQAESDRIRSDIEYAVNLKAQTEIMKLQLKVDEISAMVHGNLEKTKEEANSED